MNRSFIRTRRLVGIAVAAALSSVWLPAQAGPPPKACDPTQSGIAMPGCPSTILGELDRLQHPEIALPDLQPDVTEVYVDYESITLDNSTGQWVFGTPVLNFDTLAHNASRVPLELAAEAPASLTDSPVAQCVSWSLDLVCRQRARVGAFIWHDAHKHFHFDGFAAYELRRLLSDGEPDFTDAGLIATSPKVSFCLVDSTPVDDHALPLARYNTCTSAEEGVSPGWADVYAAGIDGQKFASDAITDGRYALVIALNTERNVYETRYDNNRVVAIIELAQIGGFFPQAGIIEKRRG